MPLGLIRHALRGRRPPPRALPAPHPLGPGYEVVVIGAGGHGLAAAYYLARDHGITDVAVLEKGWLGGGNTARNTAIVRSNYLTPEGAAFYDESRRLFRSLSGELGFNIMYGERGHLTLAHSDAALRTMRWRAEVNKHLGIDSEVVDPDALREICPPLRIDEAARFPILGALHHRPGAIARHDAVAWGYAVAAARRGVEIHQRTEVTGILRRGGRVVGVETARGRIACERVLQAVAGSSSAVARMAGLRLPIRTVPLQACVTEPLKPFLDPIVVSAGLHVYVSQTPRGELVIGGATDPYPLHAQRSTLPFLEQTADALLELFPFLAEVRVLRQWAGLADMTPDFSPVMGATPLDGYYIDAGWGTWGFKATPAAGKRMAEAVATGRIPDPIRPFSLDRFDRFCQIGERGAASVGH